MEACCFSNADISCCKRKTDGVDRCKAAAPPFSVKWIKSPGSVHKEQANAVIFPFRAESRANLAFINFIITVFPNLKSVRGRKQSGQQCKKPQKLITLGYKCNRVN